MPVLNGAETKLLAFHMQHLATSVLQREHGSIEVRLLGIPCLDILDGEVHLGAVAADGKRRTLFHGLPLGIDNVDTHRTARQGTVQENVSHEVSVGLGVDGNTLYVLCRLCYDEHGTPDATEVPVVGTSLSQVHLRNAALLQHLHLQAVLLRTEEHTV